MTRNNLALARIMYLDQSLSLIIHQRRPETIYSFLKIHGIYITFQSKTFNIGFEQQSRNTLQQSQMDI